MGPGDFGAQRGARSASGGGVVLPQGGLVDQHRLPWGHRSPQSPCDQVCEPLSPTRRRRCPGGTHTGSHEPLRGDTCTRQPPHWCLPCPQHRPWSGRGMARGQGLGFKALAVQSEGRPASSPTHRPPGPWTQRERPAAAVSRPGPAFPRHCPRSARLGSSHTGDGRRRPHDLCGSHTATRPLFSLPLATGPHPPGDPSLPLRSEGHPQGPPALLV